MLIIKPKLKETANSQKSFLYELSVEEVKELEKIINAQVEKFGLLDPSALAPALIFIA